MLLFSSPSIGCFLQKKNAKPVTINRKKVVSTTIPLIRSNLLVRYPVEMNVRPRSLLKLL